MALRQVDTISKWKNIAKSIGPGILFAGAAIGGSHLIQSTRAGANYGFTLLWVVILANILKYPFFEYGQRYTATTGKSLLEGYLHIGKPLLYLFFALSFCTAIVNCAAVTMVTGALAGFVFGDQLNIVQWSGVLFVLTIAIVFIGNYRWLDKIVKLIICVLSVSTVAAFSIALAHGGSAQPGFEAPDIWNLAGLSFLVALLGWMPAPIEASTWSSVWLLERAKETGHHPTLKETQFDFNLGYVVTAVLACCFLGLGSLVMFGTGEQFSSSGIQFAGQVVSLYADSLGRWSAPIIGIAALTTMLSTTLTVNDAYPRTMAVCVKLLFPKFENWSTRFLQQIWMLFVCGLSFCVIAYLAHNMKAMIDFATIISFLAAPVFAFLNYWVVTHDHVPTECIPSKGMKFLSWVGLGFLLSISVVFIVWRFM